MKILLDIPDNKSAFLMELLKNFSFVKAKTISTEKAQFLEEIEEAVDNLNKVKKGIIKPKTAEELLNEI